MAHIISVRGMTPRIGKNCFLAETAVIIGDVEIGDDCSIWYGAVLRGDVNPIRLGRGVNVQDNAVLHTLHQKSVVTVGDNVSIGHNATVHGADVHAGALVGMGATVLDYAQVGEGAIVAAGSLVLSRCEIPPLALFAGVPAKLVKTLTDEQSRSMALATAEGYRTYASWFLAPDVVHEERMS